MQIICYKENLVNGANLVLKAISSRTTLPILECILLEATDIFKMTSNNLEMAVETSPIEVESIVEQGSIAINAKMFSDIIKRLPEDKVIIKVDHDRVVYIKSGKAEFKLFGMDTEEFPALPEVEKLESYCITANVFKNMIRQTIFSISSLEDKPVYTGELIEIEDGVLNLVAVDNFRVSLRKKKLSESGSDIMAIVPGKTMNELSKILSTDEEVSIYFSDKHIIFETAECTLISRTIEGEFLKYKQVLNQEYSTEVGVNTKEMLDALERSTLIATENKKTPIIIKITNGLLSITSKAEAGDLYDELNISMQGESLEISFNPKFLIDAIKVIDSDYIKLGFNTQLSPCIISDDKDTSFKYLVLPLRPN